MAYYSGPLVNQLEAHLKRDKKVVFNYVKLSFKYGNEVNYSFLQIIKDYFFSKF